MRLEVGVGRGYHSRRVTEKIKLLRNNQQNHALEKMPWLGPRRVFGSDPMLGTLSILCVELEFILSLQLCGEVSYSSMESKDVG